MKKNNYFFIYIILCFFYISNFVYAADDSFYTWLKSFEKKNFILLCQKTETPPYIEKIIKFKNEIKQFDFYQPELLISNLVVELASPSAVVANTSLPGISFDPGVPSTYTAIDAP